MKSISKTPGEKEGAKYPFRPGVLSANARHHAAALRSGRNAHGLEHLPPECLQKWQLRASAWQCERMKTTPEAAIRSLPCTCLTRRRKRKPMARERSHQPSAACLSESMRDLGYSL